MLQVREKEIFETLKKIKKYKFVVIGGYAANTYALPRFSIDCDIAVEDKDEAKKVEKELEKINYKKIDISKTKVPYGGEFARYEKGEKFKVSVDLLIKNILDRQTNTKFSVKWVFENSKIRQLRGKTIIEELSLRIINPDALIVMKAISCRTTDIRDVFMLITQTEDIEWVKEEIAKRYSLKDRIKKIKEKINSEQFKNNLQGVYGYIDEKIFEKHKSEINKL